MTAAASLLVWALALTTAAAGDPECDDETWKHHVLAQARLFELHHADEMPRTDLARELANCLPRPAGGACRTEA